MASAVLPKPGSRFGPCTTECKHIDCTQTRTDALTLCTFCQTAIGYERHFHRGNTQYANIPGELAHGGCLLDAYDHDQSDPRLEPFVGRDRTAKCADCGCTLLRHPDEPLSKVVRCSPCGRKHT